MSPFAVVLKAFSLRRAPPTSGLSRTLERGSADGGPDGAFDHPAVTNRDAPNSRGLDIASAHATVHVPVALPQQSAAQVRHALAGQAFDCADDVAVLDGRRLIGIVPIERLIAAAADEPIEHLMDADPPVVAPGDDAESVVWRMVGKNDRAWPSSTAAATSEDWCRRTACWPCSSPNTTRTSPAWAATWPAPATRGTPPRNRSAGDSGTGSLGCCWAWSARCCPRPS
jgi:hypothetical protein